MVITDVVYGWSVRVVRSDKSTFVAHSPVPGLRAFFLKRADAVMHVRELKEHRMKGFVVRAQVIFKAE